MTFVICECCRGAKRVMGGGMIYHDCDNCNGSGKKDDGKVLFTDIKDTKAYTEAVDKIQSLNPELTKQDAENIFKVEFNRIDEHKRKRGRPKK